MNIAIDDFYINCPYCIYSVLTKEAGANPKNRENFIPFFKDRFSLKEFRFIGKLGFGGKIWFNDDKIYVSCYQEDETPERLAIIEKINQFFEEMKNVR